MISQIWEATAAKRVMQCCVFLTQHCSCSLFHFIHALMSRALPLHQPGFLVPHWTILQSMVH